MKNNKEGFCFRTREVVVNLAGQHFTYRVTQEFLRKTTQAQQRIQKAGEKLPDTEQGCAELFKIMANELDNLIGTGATDKIFKGRKRDVLDMVDVISYVCDATLQAATTQKKNAQNINV